MPSKKTTIGGWIIFLIVIIFVFQSPLESLWNPFKYIDESIGVLGAMSIFFYFGYHKCLPKKREIFVMLICLAIFLCSGLLGNIIYRYQQWEHVPIDIFTNFKFYFAILFGYFTFRKWEKRRIEKEANTAAKISTLILFAFFIADRVLNLYGGQVRYEIRSAVLFYYHATYLAGALVFLIAVLTVFYVNSNIVYILMNLCMLIFTMRSKAIAGAVIYLFLFWYIKFLNKKLKIWQIGIIAIITIALGWEIIYFYFVQLAGSSARSVMTMTSFKILQDYFPIGTGFGTYASHVAAQYYSPVYILYGFMDIYELSPRYAVTFLDDTFWPIILGQTGFIGTCAYLLSLFLIIKKCWKLKYSSNELYLGSIFIIVYLLISSMAEPAFNNSIAIPLGVLLGIIFNFAKQEKGAIN